MTITPLPVLTPADPDAALPPRAVAQAIDLTKIYGKGEATVVALDHVSVEFARGQLTAIMGPSGSGSRR